jgi:hypothetical protein
MAFEQRCALAAVAVASFEILVATEAKAAS